MYKFTEITEESKTPVSTGLLARMQEDILTGEMRPGEKIIEQKLCEKYGASRTPVREALKQLEADGLVEYILNRGYFVIGMSDQDFEDMFDLRKARVRRSSGPSSVSPKKRRNGWRRPSKSWSSTP